MINRKLNEQHKVFMFLMLMILGISAYGQNVRISGTVVSDTDGSPLIGVTVQIKGTTKGTSTDIHGVYSLDVNKGQTLVFSYIGFKNQEVKIDTKNTLNISLQEDFEVLDEVVVVGYGTMKRSDLTGAVVSVTNEDIKKNVVTSLDQALQGKAAGVFVTQNSGAPGGGVSVSIRGVNSFNGNEPLYVIDGVPLSGQTSGNTNALASINPADIVSMEVLKDASATAIYGSRASNGVVIITTQRGELGKTKVSYEGYLALQTLPERLDVLNLHDFAIL